MTPKSFSASADDARTLLNQISRDTHNQLLRWRAIALFLQCPFVFTRRSRRKATELSHHALHVLRLMATCADQAKRAFRKARYDHCTHYLNRFEQLHDRLVQINRATLQTMLTTIFEGSTHGYRD